MIKNYFKIGWRSIISRKLYSVLNISGLTIALSCCALIYLYISYNLSFDSYHRNPKNIFRLVYELHLQKTEYDKGASFAEFKAIKMAVPQVQQAAFLIDNQSFITTNPENTKRFKEEKNVAFTNSDWFKMFSFHLLKGSVSYLDQPGNAVLRQKTAFKYFGNTDPIGKIILFNKRPVSIVGVIADGPYNSDLKSDIYLSFSSLMSLIPTYLADKQYFFTDWGDISSVNNAFIVLNNPQQKEAVEKAIVELAKKKGYQDILKYYKFKLLPLAEQHFDTRFGGLIQKSLLLVLTLIGFLILVIAIFNYINLTIAQQAKRAREIATRKVLGGSRKQIFFQFITESLITSTIAIISAFITIQLILPFLNSWLFPDDPIYIVSFLNLYWFFALILLITTIASGFYPAFILSSISIAQILKNSILNLNSGLGRRLTVIFQNTIAQALMVSAIIIVLQVRHLNTTDIGFDRKSVMIIPLGQISSSQKIQFNESLKRIPNVESFSFCSKPPSSNSERGATVKFDNRPKWEIWPARFAIGDSSYCKTFGIHITFGKNLRNNQVKPEFLINETMANLLVGEQKELAIGKELIAGDVKGIITGIVKDFNVKSLIEPIEPSIILEDESNQTNLAVKLSVTKSTGVLNELQKEYLRILPDRVFDFQFVDQQIAQLYKKENMQQKLIWIAALVAVIISSLGLFGLVSLLVLQRTKEIGIRKVLGATIGQISILLVADFIWMVILALLIASPLSWLLMKNWLQSYAYRIDIHWWIFAISGIVTILVGSAPIGFQAIKAALMNPVKSLRSE